MKKTKEEGTLTDEVIAGLENKYDALLSEGLTENEECTPKWAKKEEKALLNRLKKYKENHLLFLHFHEVPFDNNMSERDLRKCKNRQKMSGGFRNLEGMGMYCRILSFIESCKKQKKKIFESLLEVYGGTFAFNWQKTELSF